MFLPRSSQAGAFRFARAVPAALLSQDLHHPTTTTGRVTLSVGIASAGPGEDLDPAELYRRADGALYQAKHEGRNTIRVFPANPPLAAAA